MKKIIPFQKEIPFKNNLSEIISISLEHNIQKLNHQFKGDFIISGEYKTSMNSTLIDSFHFNLPFEIELMDRYDSSNAEIDIDDFYYEIIDNQVLSVHIDVLIDKLEEKEELLVRTSNEEEKQRFLDDLDQNEENENIDNIIDDIIEEQKEDKKEIILEEDSKIIEKKELEERNDSKEEIEPTNVIKEEKIEERNEEKNKDISSMFDDFIDDNEYKTYKIYIVKEEDSIEQIIEKYKVSIEEIKKYNEISELKKGDKIIIPYVKSKQN